MGVEAKAELVIDDTNGVAITFPDISDIAEIAVGVAVDAPDGTYVVANGEDTITMVVLAGVVDSVTIDTPVAAEASIGEVDVETQAVLTAITDEVVALKASNFKLVAELKDLKASLKHGTEPVAAAATQPTKQSFKIVD